MAYKNLIYQTTTGTGTGNLTLSAVTGWRDLATAFGTGAGNPFVYVIRHQSAAEYEVGTGYMSDSTTLVRSAVVDSSNANAAVNFAAGTKDVWHSVPAADANNFVTQTLLDAKGDLIVASAADTAARLAVGTNGYSLSANSGATNGVAWERVPGEHMNHATTIYYISRPGGGANTQALSVSNLRVVPFVVPATGTYDRIGINVSATAGSSTYRLGIYAMGTDGRPGALILDAGTVDTATSTGFKEITISQSLSRGVVYLAMVPQGGTPTVYIGESNTEHVADSSGATLTSNTLTSNVYYRSSVTGALPDPFGTPTGYTAPVARIALRKT